MYKTFLGKLENHFQAIEEAQTGKNANDILLKTIKLLLDEIDSSKNCLADYDKMEMRKFFSSFGRVSQSACDFFLASKEYLDPVALEGGIGNNLKTAAAETAKINALIESINKNEADLLEKEYALNKKKAEYKELTDKIDSLKAAEKISDEYFEKLKREHDLYNLHYGENSEIVCKLKEYGIMSVNVFLSELNRHEEFIKTELPRFDKLIKDVLIEQEKIRKEIIRRTEEVPVN